MKASLFGPLHLPDLGLPGEDICNTYFGIHKMIGHGLTCQTQHVLVCIVDFNHFIGLRYFPHARVISRRKVKKSKKLRVQMKLARWAINSSCVKYLYWTYIIPVDLHDLTLPD